MDILREESPFTSPHALSVSSFDRALLLLTIIAPFVLFFYHPGHEWVGAVPLLIILLHFWRQDFGLVVKAVFWPILYVSLLYVPWPFCFILPLALYLGAYVGSRKFRLIDHWLTTGRLTRETVIWMVAIIVVSSGALLIWVLLFHPRLDDLARMIPAVRPWQLVGIGIAFSTLNATWEEFILKGRASPLPCAKPASSNQVGKSCCYNAAVSYPRRSRRRSLRQLLSGKGKAIHETCLWPFLQHNH
jgi:hypothetical protein